MVFSLTVEKRGIKCFLFGIAQKRIKSGEYIFCVNS